MLTIEVTINLIASILVFVTLIAFYKRYWKEKVYLIYIFGFSFFLNSIYWLLISYALNTEDAVLFGLFQLIIPIYSLLLVVAYNLIHYARLDPLQITVGAMINGVFILSILFGDPVNPVHFKLQGLANYLYLLSQSYTMIIYFFFSWKIHMQSPSQYKKNGGFLYLGGTLFLLLPIIITILDLDDLFPAITTIFSALGLCVIILAFYSSPYLVYILPFRAINLNVYRRSNGELLFRHEWSQDNKVNQELMYLFIQGIGNFSDEYLHFGSFKQIKLDQGTLIVRIIDDFDLIFALLATGSNEILIKSMERFINIFVLENIDEIQNLEDVGNLTRLKADQIKIAFPFVPSYL